MTTPRGRADIYTIGRSNAPAARVVALLRERQIDLLVDVRSIPASRYAPQFNRRAFVRTLGGGNTLRVHGRLTRWGPRDPICYKAGILPHGHADYLNLVDYAKVAARSWYQRAACDLVHIGHCDILTT